MNKYQDKHKIYLENEGKYKGCYVYYENGKLKGSLKKGEYAYYENDEKMYAFASDIHRLSNLGEYHLRLLSQLNLIKKDFINKYENIELKEKYLDIQIENIEKLFGFNDNDITEDYLQTQPFVVLFSGIAVRMGRIFPQKNDVTKIRQIYREWIVEENQTLTDLKRLGNATVLYTVLTWKYYKYLLKFKVIKYKNPKYIGENGYINEHFCRYITYLNENNNNRLLSEYNDGNDLEEYELMVRYKFDILKNEFENTYANIEFELKGEYLDTEIEDIEKLFGLKGHDISEDYLQIQRFWKLFFEMPPLQRMFPKTTKDVLKIRRIRREWIIKKNQTQAMLDEYGKGIVINTVKIFQYYKYLTAFRSKGKAPQRQHLRQLEQSGNFDNDTNIKEMQSKKILSSVFISYSTKDKKIAQQISKYLKDAGVETFFWEKDAPGGKPLAKIMTSNIDAKDRLLFIASENSIKSEPCQFELTRGRQKQDKLWRTILFPIHIDDFLFKVEKDDVRPKSKREDFWENIQELKDINSLDFTPFKNGVTENTEKHFTKMINEILDSLEKHS